jgi:hypothetical protein
MVREDLIASAVSLYRNPHVMYPAHVSCRSLVGVHSTTTADYCLTLLSLAGPIRGLFCNRKTQVVPGVEELDKR